MFNYRRAQLALCNVSVALLLSACGSGSSSGSSTDPVNSVQTVQATSPELSNLSPTSISRAATAGEAVVVSVSFTNSGDATLSYTLSESEDWMALAGDVSGSLSANATATTTVSLTCGSDDLSGAINLITNDANASSVTLPVNVTCAQPAANVEVARVTLNQAARSFDSLGSNPPSMDVLAGRELLVRAFLTGLGQSPDARVVVEQATGARTIVAMQAPPVISATPADESLLNASHYARIPGNAIQVGAKLKIEVAPYANPVTYPANGWLDLSVVDPGAFAVTFVPVTFQGQTPAIDPDDYMAEVMQVLPVGEVDVQVRSPYIFTDPYDLEELLTQIADLRDLDGSQRLYHAVIMPTSGSNSSTAGIGYVGYPVSVSVDLGGAGYVIAHEMGHNLNLGHAPGCDAPNADSNYPYANAEVNSWGYDVVSQQLVSPTGKRDFMSYCSDLWVSDYHFDRALDYRSQSPIGFGPPAGKGLTISGRMAAGEVRNLRMLPTDRVVMSKQSVVGEFDFVAWDAGGTQLFAQPFDVLVIEDIAADAAFTFSVPAPTAEISHVEVRRQGSTLYADVLPAPVAPAQLTLAWQEETAKISWASEPGAALIVRNASGEVMTVNRSGRFELHNVSSLRFAHTQRGSLSRQVSAVAGQHLQLRLTR